LYDTYKDYLEKMRDLTEEYNNTQDEEERARISNRIEMLKTATNNLMQGLTEDNKYTLQYLNESFFGGMGIDTSLMSAE
jgi:DNA-binding protein H-NS